MPTGGAFPTKTLRGDPYRHFRFRLKWEGRYVAGVSRVGGLVHAPVTDTQRTGGGSGTPFLVPGQTDYAPITLERGLTCDPTFACWSDKVWDDKTALADPRHGGAGNRALSLEDLRQDFLLEVYDEAGGKVLAYTLHRCWPSAFSAMSELAADGDGNGVVIENLTLQHEGWERDASIPAPD